MSESKEKVSCMFNPEINCNVRMELNKEANAAALINKWLKPSKQDNQLASYMQLMETLGKAFSNEFTVLPRFCELCLKHSLRGKKHG